MFGGQANINETGFTYADYARRGFFELVGVAVLSLGLYAGLSAITRRETPAARRAFTLLSAGLIALVLAILSSAWMRLILYEEAYGLTRLRASTHVFIPWLALLLFTVALLELFGRRGALGFALLVFVVGFTVTLPVVNMDAWIARTNLARAMEGKDLDGNTLVGLSIDAYPVLAGAYQDPASPENIRQQTGAALTCWQMEGRGADRFDWRSWVINERTYGQQLKGLDLSAFIQSRVDGSQDVIVNGQVFTCFPYGFD